MTYPSLDLLQGVRVIEFADYVFVPASASLLSEWGADVIKLEHHERGDAFRSQPTRIPPGSELPAGVRGLNPTWENANRGKRSLGLNLAHPDGLNLLYDLVAGADVFLTNRLPGVLSKLHIDVDDLRARNPSLIYVRGTGHGSQGPEADSGGFDAVDYWYRTGMASGARIPGRQVPEMPSAGMGDLGSAIAVAAGVAAALVRRGRTGEGALVDVSLLANGLWQMGSAITTSLLLGTPLAPRPEGATHYTNPLVNVFETSDGRGLAFCCLQASRYWPELCDLVGLPHLANDSRFNSPAALEEHATTAAACIADAVRRAPLEDWVERLATFTGQWTVIRNALEAAADPQAEANNMLLQMETSNGEQMTVPASPVQFDCSPARPGPAPAFNAHCESILIDDLGLDMEEVLRLKISGAVA